MMREKDTLYGLESGRVGNKIKAKPSVAILTAQFYQYSGERCLFGGGERYLIDLAKLLQKLGYDAEVFQPSGAEEWNRSYHGVPIHGIGEPGVQNDFFVGLNRQFLKVTKDFDYHIYFSMDLLYPDCFPNSICISHGIWWDSCDRSWWRSDKWYHCLFHGLSEICTLVSVDTNTIHWIDAVKPDLKCRKIYLPNYADLNQFRPGKPEPVKKNVTILFPRRLCAQRGWFEARDAALELTARYSNIIFSFVGRSSYGSGEEYMKKLASKNPRIRYTWYEMGDMPKAYRSADIVLIPSKSSEGTSLSLLEAMACGKPIIAGLTGGLTDLIIDGYNGLLIQPAKESIEKAVCYLVANPEKRLWMGRNAYEIAQTFSKEIWEKRWTKILQGQFPKHGEARLKQADI